MARQRREVLKTVLDEDLRGVLESLGLIGDFANGKLRCAICGDVIGEEDLQALFPDSGHVKAVCSKAACMKALLARLQEVD